MTRFSHKRIVFNVLLVAVGVAAGVTAAPILPGKAQLPPNMQSMADIQQVSLDVRTRGPELAGVGINEQFVRDQFTTALKSAGIQVVDADGSTPALVFNATSVTEPRVGDAVGYLYVLELHQSTHVTRIDKELVLPTFTAPVLGLEHKDDLAGPARNNVALLIDAFVQAVHAASQK